MTESSQHETVARRQTILVYVLYLLHPLFGITALIGVIICHTRNTVTQDTVFESHRIWQAWTFWAGLIGYAAGIYYWQQRGSSTILLVTFLWSYYRVAWGWWRALRSQRVGNL